MQAGEAAVQRGQFAEAEQILPAAVKKARSSVPMMTGGVAVTLAHLAQVYKRKGNL